MTKPKATPIKRPGAKPPSHRRPSRKGAASPELAAAKARVLEALAKCHGVKAAACDLAGISRQTLLNWEHADPAFAAEVAALALHDRKKDFAEYALLKLVAKGHPAAVIFANPCLNQDRGYIEKQQIEHQLPGPFVIERGEPAPPPAPTRGR